MEPILWDWSNETSWVFPSLKSTSHFLPQFGSFKSLFAFNHPVQTLLWIQKIYAFGEDKKSDFYEQWQQHKQPWKWVRLDHFQCGIYNQFQPEPTHKIHSLAAAEALSLNFILPWNISQMIMKSIPISTRIVISNVMKWGIPLWIWWKVNGNWDNN